MKHGIEFLDREDLLNLIGYYNNYVIEFYDNHDKEMTPVSVYEFFDNEYQEILENQKYEEEEY